MKKWTEPKSSIEKSNDTVMDAVFFQKEDEEQKWEKRVNILLVDDRKENLLSLEAVLDSPCYRLISVQSGEEALRWVLKEEFALILLDVQMPGLNGFETAKLIKQREKSKNIPIIFVTAISKATEHVLEGYESGAIDYIFKPFHPDTLAMKVEGFVQLYLNQQKIEYQSKMLQSRTRALEEANERYHRTVLELQKSEALSRTISETSVDTIITFDDNRLILSINPVLRTMFGYEPDEVMHKPINRLLALPFQTNEYVLDKIMESVAIRKDQTSFPVEIQIGKAMIGQRHIFVCSIRDITERKQLEIERKIHYEHLELLVEERTQELVVSQEQFKKIFHSSPCLIAIRSCDDGRYIDVNQCWLDHMQYSYDEIKNSSEDRLILVNERNSKNRSLDLEEAIRNEKIQYITHTHEVREGLLSTEIINIRGKRCILSVITDITEQVYLEKEMARLDRLHLIGEMAAGIAHEIRNPMTTVRGFLQLAQKTKNGSSFEFVDLMLAELDRANVIITEFLTLAKNKTNEMTKQHLAEALKSLLPLIEAEAVLSGKNVHIELSECPEIYLDGKEIRQLFLNLALNGLEAMPAGKTLTVKTYQKDDEVVLEVTDEGPGIQEELLEKIWTPFFTTKEKGTGLGLAVCYSVANRHHAKIDVESSSLGTSFYVRFKHDAIG
ncbi:response regulator [Brevibacillus invocatus]|uniref:histidine kinase n=1 Tax=Brevibacillus invocatus TaxID=173959 RepID=A0A3M8CF54_9BACL|nr:response regulator [Brevibacillus invocatus]RNB74382.1 response regulator [Brevibacillus invocatus]